MAFNLDNVHEKLELAVATIKGLRNIAAWVTLVYVAAHFIEKYW